MGLGSHRGDCGAALLHNRIGKSEETKQRRSRVHTWGPFCVKVRKMVYSLSLELLQIGYASTATKSNNTRYKRQRAAMPLESFVHALRVVFGAGVDPKPEHVYLFSQKRHFIFRHLRQ